MNSPPFLIFDADGVLLDSLNLACIKFNEIAATYFPELPYVKNKEDMAFVYPGPLRTSLRRFGLSDSQIANFFDLHSQEMLKNAIEINPFDDVLKILSESLPISHAAIVSSSYSDTIIHAFSKSNYYRRLMFKYIAGREYKISKSEKIKNILIKEKINPSEAIYIGDMVSDILYCREIPIRIACVDYGYHPSQYLAAFNPNILIEKIEDMQVFIRNCFSGVYN